MPTLMACANGNSTDAATWAVCDATAELDSETGTTAVAAAGTGTSSNFTPGAVTVDGVAVKLSHWTTLPTSGTVSVILRNTSAGTDVGTVTVSYADLTYVGTTASGVHGWAFFKFGSPVALLAATTYAVRVTNNANQAINLWRDATGSNWCRQLRTTTTAAPAAGDKLLVNREWTGSGTSAARTVTETRTLSATAATLPGTGANNTGVGTLAWTNPANAQADDGSYATVTSAANNAVTNYLRATNFGFAVPAGSVVTGVRVEVELKGSVANTWRDTSVRLVKAGTGGGTSLHYGAVLPTSDAVWAYGSGQNDCWGNTLGVSDVNNSGFGVELSFTHLTTTSSTVSVDYVKLTVYYVTVPYGAVVVSDGGTYQFGTAAATNYAAAVTGLAAGATSGLRGLEVCSGGTVTLGTSGSRMPSDSTALLYFGVASAVQFGAEVRGTGVLRAYGAVKTPWTRLASAAAADATALTVGHRVGDTTGWAVGDEVAIGGSNRSTSETELRTLAAVGSSTTCTLLQPLTTAKEGGNNVAGDPVSVPVANLTRNVRVCGVSAALTTYCRVAAGATFAVDSTQWQFVGSVTSGKRGIETATTTGSFSLASSVLRDVTVSSAVLLALVTTTGSCSVTSSVFYFGGSGGGSAVSVSTATSGAHTITGNCVIGRNRDGSAVGIAVSDIGSTVTGNLVTDLGIGFNYGEASAVGVPFSNNEASYCTYGLSTTATCGGAVVSSCVFARCFTAGVFGGGGSTAPDVRPHITFSACAAFGSATNIWLVVEGFYRLTSPVCYGEAAYTSTTGLTVSRAVWADVVGGTFSSHTQDVVCGGILGRLTLTDCLLGSSSEVGSQTGMAAGGLIVSVNHDQVAGAMRVWKRDGTLSSDTTIFRTASPSLRLTPNTASFKLTSVNETSGFRAAVAAGGTATLTVWVRKSVVGDGAAYNGAQPRVMLRRNPQVGVTDDTVLATASNAANGAWEQLTATTPAATAAGVFEVYVDADGTTGWVSFDDFSWG